MEVEWPEVGRKNYRVGCQGMVGLCPLQHLLRIITPCYMYVGGPKVCYSCQLWKILSRPFTSLRYMYMCIHMHVDVNFSAYIYNVYKLYIQCSCALFTTYIQSCK